MSMDKNSHSEVYERNGPGILVQVIVGTLKAISYMYELATWPLYSILSSGEVISDDQGPQMAAPTRPNDPSSPWRSVDVISDKNLPRSMFPDCYTLNHIWDRAVKRWPNRKAFGTRELLKVENEVQPSGRTFVKLTQGRYIWKTYIESDMEIRAISSGLTQYLELRSCENADDSDRVVIFAETRVQWLLCAQACCRTNIPLVTLYSTLGDDALVHGVNESETRVMITSDALLPKVVALLPRMPAIETVIYMDSDDINMTGSDLVNWSEIKLPDSVDIMSLRDLQREGQEILDDQKQKFQTFTPLRDDLVVIMYTSGSTDVPKGVEITHESIMSTLAGDLARLPSMSSTGDIYIAYLPLAHVLELCCELALSANCIPIGYGSPLTLTNNSSKVKAGTKGDLSELRPTLMTCVPTILNRIHQNVWETVNESGSLVRELFKWSLEYKSRRLAYGFRSFLLDRLVFRRIRSLLGGRVRFMLCGGAPLREDAHAFINACFGRIIQGYGLTETCAAGTIMEEQNIRVGHVGAPIPTVEIRLREWKEGNYSAWDEPFPRGEILIGGGAVTRGYYKQPEKTAEAYFTDDEGKRWFCTGDIGLFHPDGTLSIIDRKKDLVKLQDGEYVSLGKVELALGGCELLDSLCIHADNNRSNVVAIAVPKQRALFQLAKEELGLSETNYERLLQREDVNKAVLNRIRQLAREKKLSTYECPVAIHLDSHAWTPDTGLVTEAFKLRRKFIEKRYRAYIDKMYDQVDG